MKTASTREVISCEREFNTTALIIGMPLFIAGLVCSFIGIGLEEWPLIPAGILTLFFAYIVLLPFHVIEFDPASRQIHKYCNYYFFRPGKIIDLARFHSVAVEYESGAAVGTIAGVNTRFHGSTYRHFSIVLLGEGKKEFIKELNEFGKANEFLRQFAGITGLKAIPLPGGRSGRRR